MYIIRCYEIKWDVEPSPLLDAPEEVFVELEDEDCDDEAYLWNLLYEELHNSYDLDLLDFKYEVMSTPNEDIMEGTTNE